MMRCHVSSGRNISTFWRTHCIAEAVSIIFTWNIAKHLPTMVLLPKKIWLLSITDFVFMNSTNCTFSDTWFKSYIRTTSPVQIPLQWISAKFYTICNSKLTQSAQFCAFLHYRTLNILSATSHDPLFICQYCQCHITCSTVHLSVLSMPCHMIYCRSVSFASAI
jgi:hypothetical protein